MRDEINKRTSVASGHPFIINHVISYICLLISHINYKKLTFTYMSTHKPLDAYSYLVKIIYIKNIKYICMSYKLIGIHITT